MDSHGWGEPEPRDDLHPDLHPDLDALLDVGGAVAKRVGFPNLLTQRERDRLDLSYAIAVVKFDRVRDGYQCRIEDRDGRALAIVVGFIDDHPLPDAFDLTVTHSLRGDELLPVRPQPQPSPDADPHPVALTLSLSTRDGIEYTHSVTHTHTHHHTQPDDALRIALTHRHTHDHTTPSGQYWDDRRPHDDHAHDPASSDPA